MWLNPTVMPGSSIFGSLSACNFNANAVRATANNRLQLKIDVARKIFWRFEPTQLELELSVAKGEGNAISVPEVLDPGNNRFRIMIENDLGERYLYRATHRTCGHVGTVLISTGKPYRRDLPLFGQSGGYTFRRAGRHLIWAELDLDDGRLRSNDIEVYVKSEVRLNAIEREARAVLGSPRIASLLFHREDLDDQIGIRKLARYIEKIPDTPASAEINYCLGRAIIKRSSRNKENADLTKRHAQRFIEQALSHDDLGIHQRIRAQSLLDEMKIPNSER